MNMSGNTKGVGMKWVKVSKYIHNTTSDTIGPGPCTIEGKLNRTRG